MSEYIVKDAKELEKYIASDLKKVQKMYANDLLDILNTIEEENVYNKPAIDYVGYSSSSNAMQKDRGFWMYERTEDLYNLFKATFKGSNQYNAVMSIIPMDSALSHSWEDYQHASPDGDDLTAEGYLTIIEEGLPSNKTMFGQKINPRPFWDEFLDYIEGSQAQGLYEEMLKRVVNVYDVGAGIS